MAEALAVKYRPRTLDEIIGQGSVIKILTRQVQEKTFKNAYLFCGASGEGKTTAARAFAKAVNNNYGSPIEIDAASNNGVDNVKAIIKSASERSIDSEYKIYIIDEAHALTSQAWQAFLKCIEEPPTYTIFIFCTTDPQKIPDTIKNRVQQFRFNRIAANAICDRLRYICRLEGYTNYELSTEYISKIADGGMRTAISYLDKCANYSTDLSMDNVVYSLGNYSYEVFFELINNMIDGNEKAVLQALSDFYDNGNDLKLFVDQFLSFCLDVWKYAIFKNCNMTKIPSSMEQYLINSVNFNDSDKYYAYVTDKLLNLKTMLKNDQNPRTTVELLFIQITRCV